ELQLRGREQRLTSIFAQSPFGMIEWDSDIPAFSTMLSELDRVRNSSEKYPLVNFSQEKPVVQANYNLDSANDLPSFKELMNNFQSCVLDNKNPGDWVADKDNFSAAEQLNVYQYAYRKRLFNAIVEDYPQTRELTGDNEFDILIRTYIEHNPSTYATLQPYIHGFADFLAHQLSPHAELAKTEAMISELRNQPQTKTVTLAMIAQIEPANMLDLKLRLAPMTKLAGNTLYICDKLQVYRQKLTNLEYEGLKSIDQESSIGEALQRLYEHDLCTADNALTTLQALLRDFVPKGIFVRPEDI
ncbi:MAG: putative DNA-binding domain-containing protein, partial [Porticoccaceae bacterium]|nr:putative DNA-binding domain-containing protein [Porticoccaceae bacterium]